MSVLFNGCYHEGLKSFDIKNRFISEYDVRNKKLNSEIFSIISGINKHQDENSHIILLGSYSIYNLLHCSIILSSPMVTNSSYQVDNVPLKELKDKLSEFTEFINKYDTYIGGKVIIRTLGSSYQISGGRASLFAEYLSNSNPNARINILTVGLSRCRILLMVTDKKLNTKLLLPIPSFLKLLVRKSGKYFSLIQGNSIHIKSKELNSTISISNYGAITYNGRYSSMRGYLEFLRSLLLDLLKTPNTITLINNCKEVFTH